jgi:hypothetical protein
MNSLEPRPLQLSRVARVARVASVAVMLLGAACRMQEDTSTTGSATADPPPPAPSPSPTSHVVIDHPPAQGEVAPIVKGELEKAERDGRRLVVYEGATWCQPCQQLHHAIDRGELDAAFPQLTLLEFDADRDGERLLNAGYTSKYIPLLALPRSDGSASGKQVEGGVKGDGAVQVISGKLRQLLANR